jgi:hypothetical protein
MMEDEFFLDDDELNADCEIGPTGKEKIVILEVLEKIINDLKDNIRFGEKGDEHNNFSILSGYVSYISDIITMENNNESENRILEALKDIDQHVREMSYADVALDVSVDDGNVGGIDLLPNAGSNSDDFDF